MYFPTPFQNTMNPGAELEWRQLLLFWACLHLWAWGGGELFRDLHLLLHLAADRFRRIPACSSAPCCGASQGWTPQLFWSSRLRIFRHLQGLLKPSEDQSGNFSWCSNSGCHSSYLAQYQNPCTALSCPLGTSKTSKKTAKSQALWHRIIEQQRYLGCREEGWDTYLSYVMYS